MKHEFTRENQDRIQDLIATLLKLANRSINYQKRLIASTLWNVLEDEVMEEHAERVAGIKRYFFELETSSATLSVKTGLGRGREQRRAD